MAILENYKGLQVPDSTPGDGGQAIKDDFKSLADWHPKSNWQATQDPTGTDDVDQDYQIGSAWLNTSTNRLFVCTDNTAAAAKWQVTPNHLLSDEPAGVQGRVFIGSANSQPLIIKPAAGTALQADDEGDPRGQDAVDLQQVRGPSSQVASGGRSVIGGGYSNTASGTSATVGGGYVNSATGSYATVAGGNNNQATGQSDTVAGGRDNWSGTYAGGTVGGGRNNSAGGVLYSTVAGGYSNTAAGSGASVGGGANNAAVGDYSLIPGGEASLVLGSNSAGIGSFLYTSHNRSIVIGVGTDASNRLSAVAASQIVLGFGTNPTTVIDGDYLMMGDGSHIRLKRTTGTPTTKQNGDMWVDSNGQVYIHSNNADVAI